MCMNNVERELKKFPVRLYTNEVPQKNSNYFGRVFGLNIYSYNSLIGKLL